MTLNGETKSITDKSTTSQLFDGLSDGTSYTAQVTVKNDLISSGVESAIGITRKFWLIIIIYLFFCVVRYSFIIVTLKYADNSFI